MKLNSLRYKTKSIRIRLFLILSITILTIIVALILMNNIILKSFFLYSKEQTLLDVYNQINEFYKNPEDSDKMKDELQKIAVNNNFDILIQKENYINVYTSNREFGLSNIEINKILEESNKEDEVLYEKDSVNIKKVADSKTNMRYVLLSARLDNGYYLYIKLPLQFIYDSVKISNTFLYLIGGATVIISGIVTMFIAKRFTEPILELNDIAKRMAKLDFSKKYQENEAEDEINNLGKSINEMSRKLETTIKQLRTSNTELERDIEEKSKIDEMRRTFISDVSHELKTPIALIQGYSEGLIENVNSDEENRKFYAEVIQDEANKMDKLVKELLELMKIEYGGRKFNNTNFNIVELVNEVIRKSKVMLEENKIKVKFENEEEHYVYADEFYMEQILTNYFTNAIKNADEIEKEKYIEIKIEEKESTVRISVFNTGKNISEENLNKIWKRFYKEDSSRNREAGGSGIGLSLVKAIMDNYKNEYGVINKYNGVEFYFELNKIKYNK